MMTPTTKQQSPVFAIQYLEGSPDLGGLEPSSVVSKLRQAIGRLPLSHLLIGWHLPASLLEACCNETERLKLRLYRWQPLLTTDGEFEADPSWQVEGLAGHKVPGFHNLPEFTFLCPNHTDVQEVVLSHLEELAHQEIYQGFFLDRIRYPSPSTHPFNDLACFCMHCQRKAEAAGLDLEEIRKGIVLQLQRTRGRIILVRTLLSDDSEAGKADLHSPLSQFLAFRQRSISDFLALVARRLRSLQVEIGLDCFSPCLAPMVGQNLKPMSEKVDWVKLMTYAHAFAPAGLPYELSGLLQSLMASAQLDERQALDLAGEAIQLPIPDSCKSLQEIGLSSAALEREVKRGIAACSTPAYAGIELVNLPGVTNLRAEQILTDLAAIKRAEPSGLVISWDLRHIPLEHLDLVRRVYLGND